MVDTTSSKNPQYLKYIVVKKEKEKEVRYCPGLPGKFNGHRKHFPYKCSHLVRAELYIHKNKSNHTIQS